MTSVALAATLHDASGALLEEVERHAEALRHLYPGGVSVATSPPTSPAIVNALREAGMFAGSPSSNERGPLYRLSVRAALTSGPTHVHYLDFDRALHWQRSMPAEPAALLRRASTHPVMLVGRTERAHRSHHRPLYVTETIANRVMADRCGWSGRVDGLVPSFVLERAGAESLLQKSRVRGEAVYGEWLALVVSHTPEVAYAECRGLDWETPDRDPRGVAEIGLDAWRDRFDTESEWQLRTRMAEMIVRGFDRVAARHRTTPRPGLVRVAVRVPPDKSGAADAESA